MVLDLPHRQFVFALPKALRVFFRHDRRLFEDARMLTEKGLLDEKLASNLRRWNHSGFRQDAWPSSNRRLRPGIDNNVRILDRQVLGFSRRVHRAPADSATEDPLRTVLRTVQGKGALSYGVRIHFIHGRHDAVSSHDLAFAYYQMVGSERKSFTTFEDAAHMAHYDRPDEFAAIVIADSLRSEEHSPGTARRG